jgi:hypothetical protein
MQLLMQQGAPAPEAEKKGPPQWMYFIPGFGQGVAARRRLDAEEQQLKLRKQQLAGQKAAQQIQQLQLMQKIENEQRRQRWAGLYGSLIANDDVLDDQSRATIEGQLAQELAEAGELDFLQKLEEARRARREVRKIEAIQAAPELAESPEAEAQGTLGPSPTALGRDRLRLAGLAHERQRLEREHRGYAKYSHNKRFKDLAETTRQRLADVNAEIARTRKLLQAAETGVDVGRLSPVKLAYLATGEGPEAERARKALALLPQGRARETMATLAIRAAKGDADAAQALEALKSLRVPSGRRKVQQTGEPEAAAPAPRPKKTRRIPVGVPAAQDPTIFHGEGLHGQGRSAPMETPLPDWEGPLPTVKKFRRVK